MFKEETTLIIGAGASSHYKYPLGEELTKEIREQASNLIRFWRGKNLSEKSCPVYCNDLMKRENINDFTLVKKSLLKECQSLIERLNQVNPLSIDSFLHKNASLHNIGKLIISWIILDREHKSLAASAPGKLPDDDWLRFVLNALKSRCDTSADLLKNKIHFVTFNYDVSLEVRLLAGLTPNDFRGGPG